MYIVGKVTAISHLTAVICACISNYFSFEILFQYHASTLKTSDLSHAHPIIDYTPPAYITLLFTDLGVLTPSAISDELIKLYC